MPGTVVRDAIETELFAGATLNAAGTTNGTAKDVVWPQEVQFLILTGTVTGTTPTLNVTIQGADNAAFDENVVDIVKFPQIGDEDDATFQITTYVDKKWIRANVVVAGTTPVFTGSTCKVVLPHTLRTRATTTA